MRAGRSPTTTPWPRPVSGAGRRTARRPQPRWTRWPAAAWTTSRFPLSCASKRIEVSKKGAGRVGINGACCPGGAGAAGRAMKPVLRWLGLVLAALLALQLYFVVRIAAMTLVDPQSTAFERSQAWRQWHDKGSWRWRQQWVAYPQIADNLKRAVIAAEDDSFIYHDGVDWDALEKAWQRNAKAEAQAAKQQAAKAPATQR